MKLMLTPKWGIRIFALWALVLAFLALSNLLLLTEAVAFLDNRIWIIFILQSAFGAGFGASVYGLWQQQNWGRVLFLWTIVIWFGLNTIALVAPDLIFFSTRQQNATALILNGARYAIALFIPLWYFNRPSIKAIFNNKIVETV